MQSRGVLLSLLQNRSCPKCHTRQTKDWLDARTTEVLPTYYFHVTITVPQGLRALLRTNQRDGYALLMKAAADAIIELAHAPVRRRHRRRAGCSPECRR
ncbi:MAG TPA: transposase zinc-binding domain-containing protein [Bradyrhizobium sp.]|nr:transposase zinc-binding domain-containing protein [Bradyrhizobium sp.]